MNKKKMVLLQHYYNDIGGVETFLLNFVRQFHNDYDITFVCRDISLENAYMLSEYVDVIIELTSPLDCDICILTSVLVDKEYYYQINYKKVYRMIHSDWTAMKQFWSWTFEELDPKTEYIAVSDIARESFIREYNRDSVVIPNLIYNQEYDLKLCSFTRLTEEKGYDLMCKFCDLLDKYGIKYIWDVFGTNPNNVIPYGNIRLHSPIADCQRLMKAYDYVCQFSKTESFCYTMYEAWTNGVPTLVTPFPNAVKDVKEGKNGYLIPFDMKLTKKDIDKIINKVPKNVEYKQEGVVELWKELLK
ncbi:MAG: glycosyltransferase [Bacilli bacterium]|nr:glycosyltransferase [Bacilli bacterium]